jgi:2'-5' RNA ligase
LKRLAQAAQAAGRRSGIDMEEGRPFRPHLTLARARGRRESVDLRPYVEALGAFQSRTWTATELSLVRSRLPGGGVPGEQPHYEPVAAWLLGG